MAKPAARERRKDPKVNDATITEDGCIVVTMNQRIFQHTADILFTPDVLMALAEDYGVIPPKDYNDYPGVPVVDTDAVFAVEAKADTRRPEDAS